MYIKTILKNVEISNHGACQFQQREISESEFKKKLKTLEWDMAFFDFNGETLRLEKTGW